MSALQIAMTSTEAKQVTARIKLLFSSVTDSVEKIKVLIDQAEAGEAWLALEYPSWTAYFTEEFSGLAQGLEKVMRGRVVAVLAEAGMSTRAIAPVVGVSKDTVHRDLQEQVSHDETPDRKVIGTDGKSYIRPNGKPSARAMQATADAVNATNLPKRKTPRRPLPDQYKSALWELEKSITRIEKHQVDDRFRSVIENHDYLTGRLASLADRLHRALVEHASSCTSDPEEWARRLEYSKRPKPCGACGGNEHQSFRDGKCWDCRGKPIVYPDGTETPTVVVVDEVVVDE